MARISIWLNPTGCIYVIYGAVFPASPHRAAPYRTPYRKKKSHREKKPCNFLPGNFYKANRMRMIRVICTTTGYRSGALAGNVSSSWVPNDGFTVSFGYPNGRYISGQPDRVVLV